MTLVAAHETLSGDVEFIALDNKLASLSRQIMDLLANESNIYFDFEEVMHHLTGEKILAVYKQGLQDAVRLLNRMGMVEHKEPINCAQMARA